MEEIIISDEQQQEAKELLMENRDIFAQTMDDLGQTNAVCHEINTGEAVPIN